MNSETIIIASISIVLTAVTLYGCNEMIKETKHEIKKIKRIRNIQMIRKLKNKRC